MKIYNKLHQMYVLAMFIVLTAGCNDTRDTRGDIFGEPEILTLPSNFPLPLFNRSWRLDGIEFSNGVYESIEPETIEIHLTSEVNTDTTGEVICEGSMGDQEFTDLNPFSVPASGSYQFINQSLSINPADGSGFDCLERLGGASINAFQFVQRMMSGEEISHEVFRGAMMMVLGSGEKLIYSHKINFPDSTPVDFSQLQFVQVPINAISFDATGESVSFGVPVLIENQAQLMRAYESVGIEAPTSIDFTREVVVVGLGNSYDGIIGVEIDDAIQHSQITVSATFFVSPENDPVSCIEEDEEFYDFVAYRLERTNSLPVGIEPRVVSPCSGLNFDQIELLRPDS